MADPWAVKSVEPVSDPWAVTDVKPIAKAKPYTVRGEVEQSVGRLKTDLQTAYRPTPDQAKRQDNIFAVDRLGSDLIDVPVSVGRGVVNKYVNKPLSRATGIPEDVIGAVEMTAGMMAGAPSTNALARGGAARMAAKPVPKPPPAVRAKPMSLEELGTAKNDAYKAVDSSGVTYRPEAFHGLASSVSTALAKEKLNPLRHPKAASMVADLGKMAKAGHAPTLTELDQLRQVVRRDVANSNDASEAHMGRAIIKQIDAFVDATGPQHVSTGQAGNAAALIRNARDLNTRHRKVETVMEAVESAKNRAGSTNSGGNVDNAIRQNLRRVLEKTPNLTPAETALLRSIVMGTKGQNTLRYVGKLAPQGLGAQLQIAALIPTGGLSGVVGLAGAGSKIAADAITTRKVQKLVELMSIGGGAAKKAAQTTMPKSASINSLAANPLQERTNRVGGR